MLQNEGPSKEQIVESRSQDRLALQIGRMVLAGFQDKAHAELLTLALDEKDKELAALRKKLAALEPKPETTGEALGEVVVVEPPTFTDE